MVTPASKVLHCDMERSCSEPVTHIDDQGYVYCERHGKQRRGGGIRCRVLLVRELRQLQSGQPLGRY